MPRCVNLETENAVSAEFERDKMLKRIITSIVALCVLVPVLIWSDTVVLPAAVAFITVIGLYEMYKCIGKHKNIAVCLPAYALAVLSPFALRYLAAKTAFSGLAFIAAVLYLIYLFYLTVASRGKMTFGECGEIFAVTLYIIAALSSIVYIRDLEGGKYLYLLIFIGAWITDTFAYFTGMLLGKHKLIPEVSPKKTVEGSIGGTLFCIIAFAVFGIIVDRFFGMDANLVFLAVSGAVIAVVSQIGDLIMSVIKRHYNIKDYGKIFPGHGGILDRFDSILAVALVMCAICIFAGVSGISLI